MKRRNPTRPRAKAINKLAAKWHKTDSNSLRKLRSLAKQVLQGKTV